MNELLFEIDNMTCSYTKNLKDKVLSIEHLAIPKHSITFFVGPSGIGKSTILETLGFMNDTVCKPVGCFKYMGRDMSCSWNWPDSEKSAFRNKEFSFVFQQTNLMPNFTAYENVITTALIQGMSKKEAMDKTKLLFQQLSVPATTDRLSAEYSGGQQQRIAFARAILPQFNVLFGDEPTGNLDPKLAHELMDILYQKLIEKQSSAIIVSHDLGLAVKYASTIVKIQKKLLSAEGEEYYGVIDESSIFTKDGDKWSNQGKNLTEQELLSKIQ